MSVIQQGADWLGDKARGVARSVDPTTSDGIKNIAKISLLSPIMGSAAATALVTTGTDKEIADKIGEITGVGGSKNNQTITTEPWEKQQPYLEQLFRDAKSAYGSASKNLPALNPNTIEGLQGLLGASKDTSLSDLAQSKMNPLVNFKLPPSVLNAYQNNPAAGQMDRLGQMGQSRLSDQQFQPFGVNQALSATNPANSDIAQTSTISIDPVLSDISRSKEVDSRLDNMLFGNFENNSRYQDQNRINAIQEDPAIRQLINQAVNTPNQSNALINSAVSAANQQDPFGQQYQQSSLNFANQLGQSGNFLSGMLNQSNPYASSLNELMNVANNAESVANEIRNTRPDTSGYERELQSRLRNDPSIGLLQNAGRLNNFSDAKGLINQSTSSNDPSRYTVNDLNSLAKNDPSKYYADRIRREAFSAPGLTQYQRSVSEENLANNSAARLGNITQNRLQNVANNISRLRDPSSSFISKLENQARQNPSDTYLNRALNIDNQASNYVDMLARSIDPAINNAKAIEGMGNQANNLLTEVFRRETSGTYNPTNATLRDLQGFSNDPGVSAAQEAVAKAGNNPAMTGLTSFLQQDLTGGNNIGDQFYKNLISSDIAGLNPGSRYTANALGTGALSDNATRSLLEKTATGGFLNDNPYLDKQFDRASDRVKERMLESTLPALQSAFSLSGRYGSKAHQNALSNAQTELGDTLNNLATDIYGNNYARERQLQEQAINSLGGLNAADMNRGLQAAGQLSGDYLAALGQRQQAAQGLNQNVNTQLQGTGQRLNALQGLGSIYGQGISQQLQGANALSGMFNNAQQNTLSKAGLQNQMFQQGQQNMLNAGNLANSVYNSGVNAQATAGGLRQAGAAQNANNIAAAGNLANNIYGNNVNTMLNVAGQKAQNAQNQFNNLQSAGQFAGNVFNNSLNKLNAQAGVENQMIGNRMTGLNQAGNLYNQAYQTRGNLLQNYGAAQNAMQTQGVQNLANAGNLALSGRGQTAGIYNNAGSLAQNSFQNQMNRLANAGNSLAGIQQNQFSNQMNNAGAISNAYNRQTDQLQNIANLNVQGNQQHINNLLGAGGLYQGAAGLRSGNIQNAIGLGSGMYNQDFGNRLNAISGLQNTIGGQSDLLRNAASYGQTSQNNRVGNLLNAANTASGVYGTGVNAGLQGANTLLGLYGQNVDQNLNIGQFNKGVSDTANQNFFNNYDRVAGLDNQRRDAYSNAAGLGLNAYNSQFGNMLDRGQLNNTLYQNNFSNTLDANRLLSGIGSQNFNDYMGGLNTVGNLYQGSGAERRADAQGYLNTAIGQRDNIMKAIGMLPSVDSMRYTPAQTQANVGQFYDNYNQANADRPFNMLGKLGGLISGNYGSTQTGPAQSGTNPLFGGIGAGLTAFGMGANPWVAGGIGLFNMLQNRG